MCSESVEASFPLLAELLSQWETVKAPSAAPAKMSGAAPPKQEEKSLSVQESVSEISDSDVAKFPALFGVRTIIKTDPEEARSQLIEAGQDCDLILSSSYHFSYQAVGYLFLSRMLRSKEMLNLQAEFIKYSSMKKKKRASDINSQIAFSKVNKTGDCRT